jgi:peptide deformylase
VSLLEIHVLGAPVLRQETQTVAEVTDEIRRLADDMFETMYAASGIGLAAPQVGRRERLFVVDVDENPLVFINPELVTRDGAAKGEEGCLSIPDIYGDVERPARVTMRALDRDGNPFELSADELLGRCLQHELDHLHGRLFVDYLSILKRRAAMAKWDREKAKYPSLRRTVSTISAKDAAEQHNHEAL